MRQVRVRRYALLKALVLQAASPLHTVKFLMKQSFAILWNWVRVHFFRLWTALLVLGAYGYLWVNKPEYLTWWKRSLNTLIERGCDRLPYPWGDQIESTLGNFGIWIQLTFAILIVRAALGLALILVRAIHRR